MGLFSKVAGGGSKPRQVAMEIKGPGQDLESDAAQSVLLAALGQMGEPHTSRLDGVELHISPGGDRWFVVLKTTKITDVEEAEFEARAAECLQAIGPRLR